MTRLITHLGSKGFTSTPSHPTRAALLVDRLESARQQQHRDRAQVRLLLDEPRHFVAVHARHADVGQHDVGPVGGSAVDGLLAVARPTTTRTSSSANVSSMTRWIVTLSSASSSVGGHRVTRGSTRGSGVTCDEVDDLLHRRAGQEDARDADRLQLRHVHVGDDPADDHQHVVQALLFQQFHDARADVHVRAGQDRQADDVGVLLQRGADDLLGRLAQAGVDDLHARRRAARAR